MGTRWLEDPAEGERLVDPLARLGGAVSRMLDGLPPAAAPPPGRSTPPPPPWSCPTPPSPGAAW
jgi:hypothetical protein